MSTELSSDQNFGKSPEKGEQSSPQIGKKISRRAFLKGLAVAASLAAVGASVRVDAGSAEQLKESDVELFGDLTPGIGIGVAWNGTNSRQWNPIVENIIKATTGVGIAPHVFVPLHLDEDFRAFIEAAGLDESQYHRISSDPEYMLSDDAVEIGSGAAVKVPVQKGYISSWMRDWGTMTGVHGDEIVQLNTRKENMPDPLRGTGIEIEAKDMGLKFDGGAYFHVLTDDGKSLFLANKQEFVNGNEWLIKRNSGDGRNTEEEVVKLLKNMIGESAEVIFLPTPSGLTVDHIDTYVMPVGGNEIIVGQSAEGDPNFETFNEVAERLKKVGLNVSRVPVRLGDRNSIISFANVLPHIGLDGKKFLFMPVYDGYETDADSAEAVYRELGFEVVRVDATSVKDKSGSVHCATNTSVTAPFIFNK